jgi:hypothetical protein
MEQLGYNLLYRSWVEIWPNGRLGLARLIGDALVHQPTRSSTSRRTWIFTRQV